METSGHPAGREGREPPWSQSWAGGGPYTSLDSRAFCQRFGTRLPGPVRRRAEVGSDVPCPGPRPAAVVLGWEGRAGSAGSRTIHGRTAATWRWIGQGEVTLEPRSRRIGFPGDPEPKCRSRLRKQCLHRKAGVACRLPASVGADGGGLRARPRVAEARGWTGSVCDAARENADVFPTRGFQRLRSWARGSAWGHAVLRHAVSLTGRAGRSSWASPAPQGPGRRECSASVRGCRHRTFAASRFL